MYVYILYGMDKVLFSAIMKITYGHPNHHTQMTVQREKGMIAIVS